MNWSSPVQRAGVLPLFALRRTRADLRDRDALVNSFPLGCERSRKVAQGVLQLLSPRFGSGVGQSFLPIDPLGPVAAHSYDPVLSRSHLFMIWAWREVERPRGVYTCAPRSRARQRRIERGLVPAPVHEGGGRQRLSNAASRPHFFKPKRCAHDQDQWRRVVLPELLAHVSGFRRGSLPTGGRLTGNGCLSCRSPEGAAVVCQPPQGQAAHRKESQDLR
jgi:hypothetical protein